MAGVRGVYQGQRLRKHPKPDPSMPTSKMVLWEGLGSDKSSVLGLLPLCSQLLLASRTPGTVLCSSITARDANY